jgi:hypothetical protein
MENMDPSEWASDLQKAKNTCLENFELFMNKLQMMYGDKNRCLYSVAKAMQEYQQLPKE